jgi:hypothetical protein
MMNQGFIKRLAVVGLSGLLAAPAFTAEAGRKADADAGAGTDLQITIVCQVLEMPAAVAKTLFGAQGVLPGGDITAEFWQRIEQSKGVDVLSAPRVTSRPGQSAQIKVCDQRSFATNFKVTANGAWEPVFTPTEIGLTMTVVVNPYPNDAEKLRGVAEISLSRLVAVNEQKVTPPGQKDPFTLQIPEGTVKSRINYALAAAAARWRKEMTHEHAS